MKEREKQRYYTPKELASAVRVHIKTVYRWLRHGSVPSIRPSGDRNGIILIPRDGLLERLLVSERERRRGR